VQGIVFPECLDMVAERFTPEMTDRMLTGAVSSDGTHTAVGTYVYHEIVQLVVQLSTLTSMTSPRLLHPSHERGSV
jgi:hypothetical protein